MSKNQGESYRGNLLAFTTLVEAAMDAVKRARLQAFDAEMLAPVAHKQDIRRIGEDLDAIVELLDEKIPETIQKLAEDEVGSLG